jgi:glycosyltransferase involved in cell wall biosynthesis
MTIGIDIRVLMDAQYSGVAEYTYHLLRALLEEDKVNDYVLFYNNAKDVSARLPKFNQPNISFVGRRFPNKLLNYGLFKILNWPKVDRLMKRQLDVFWMPHFNFVAWPSAKNFLTVHDLSFLRYQEFFSARKNFWHSQFKAAKLIKEADNIIAISRSTKRDIIDLTGVSPDKVTVIYSGVSADYQPLAEDDSRLLEVKNKYQLPDKFILFVGTIEPRKNLIGLIEAYNHLRQNYPELAEVKLALAGGNGWKFKEVYRAVKASPFKNDIKFLGYVEASDKCPLYNLAEVFAFPSFYEGFGFPPLEAMACGTPVVASFASSIPEVVGEAGILIDPYDPAQISEAIAQVLSDKNLAQTLSGLGLQRAKEFSWKKTAKQYLEGFNK